MSIRPEPRNIELWRLRTNLLMGALQKAWPTERGATIGRNYLAAMGQIVVDSCLWAPEGWVQPVLLPLANYAGKLREAMVPLANTGPRPTVHHSLYDDYLSKVAWGTNSIGTNFDVSPEIEHLMEAINKAALADLLRKEGDPLALSTAEMLTIGGGLASTQRRKLEDVDGLQRELRLADSFIVTDTLVPLLARIQPSTPENTRFLEEAAAAARLLPEERQKIGLK